MDNNQRIARWDNIKFFMMSCVVIGHTLYQFHGSSQLAKSLYLFIYTFHMPVFVFVAGMFSKKTIQRKRFEVVVEYGLLYMAMKFLETFGEYLYRGRIRFHFFWEDGPAWFALAIAVFLIITMMIKDFEPIYMIIAAILIGCLAGLDNHLGDHFASMRICVFYPVFLSGYYTNPSFFELKSFSSASKTTLKICSILFLGICFFLCITKGETLYPFIKLLKGKYDYISMGYSMNGVVIRFLCYAFWALLILAVIFVNTEKERIYTWLGTRTLAVFLWHNFVIVLLFKVFRLTSIMKKNMPTYYVFGAICIAMIIEIMTSYFPQFRIAGKIMRQKKGADKNEV